MMFKTSKGKIEGVRKPEPESSDDSEEQVEQKEEDKDSKKK